MLNVWKPWFVYNPRQLLRRVSRAITKPQGQRVDIPLPWNVTIAVDPTETIGRSLWTTGIYDIAVSEALYRLTPPGGRAVDAGANIGYMTGILATRVGPQGQVHSFEPHPELVERLRENVKAVSANPQAGPVTVHAVALSDREGTARLVMPDSFADNHGVGFLGTAENGSRGFDVPTARLDDLFPEQRIDVMKMDVEGHEPAVLKGAAQHLGERTIGHIVFEEHQGPDAETIKILQGHGYTVLRLGWQMDGLRVAGLNDPPIHHSYEAPSFLATLEPDRVRLLLSARGWRLYS